MTSIRVSFKGHCPLESMPKSTEHFTPGKEYDAILVGGDMHSQDMYYLRNDRGNLVYLFSYRFKPV